MIYSIIAITFALFPQDFPVSHWLAPCSWIEHVCYIPSQNDPNMLLKFTDYEVTHRLDMTDFAIYARQYPGDPNRPSGYYLCPRNKDALYHVPYPDCPATKGYKMQAITAKDLAKYSPDPVCIPPEPTLAEVLKDVNDLELRQAIMEMMK